jgi:mannose-6-phosphate isomerase-like protein (cupin superfamily)
VAVSIPADIEFQFRCLADEPLTFLCVTMLRWREGANVRVADHWPVTEPALGRTPHLRPILA